MAKDVEPKARFLKPKLLFFASSHFRRHRSPFRQSSRAAACSVFKFPVLALGVLASPALSGPVASRECVFSFEGLEGEEEVVCLGTCGELTPPASSPGELHTPWGHRPFGDECRCGEAAAAPPPRLHLFHSSRVASRRRTREERGMLSAASPRSTRCPRGIGP